MPPRWPTGRRCLTAAACLMLLALATVSGARTLDVNRGWKFTLGDPPGAHTIAFDTSGWRTVRTPHDWAIAGPFDPDAHGHAAKLPWEGVGWYRRFFSLDRAEEGSRVYLDFDGVMASPQVYVNGEPAGEWDYGYTPFRVDLTPHVRFGRSNVVAVRVDTTGLKTRWYPGAGIYRDVTLRVSPPVHLAHHGTAITTPTAGAERAEVVVANEIDSHLDVEQELEVAVTLRGPDGAEAGHATQTVTVPAGATVFSRLVFDLPQPKRWDIDRPVMYTALTELVAEERVVEQRTSRFGVREFRFTADDGFRLNGRRVELRGVNLHHDHGPLGAGFNRRAAERQLEIMQAMGANAVRTAHNPPAEGLLELCDERGLLVWDELFDKWGGTAGRKEGRPAFERHAERHAAALVRRDRNHPSVIAWSIGNEILDQSQDPEGKSRERIAFLREQVLRHDASRPVGLGCFLPSTAATDTLADLDLTGWNYQQRYVPMREHWPEKPIVYSESASALSTRGHYVLPLPNHKCDFDDSGQVNAYELSSAAWADLAEVEFERLRSHPYLVGEFVWTGFDYLGEPTPYDQRARSSYFGIVDLVGLPKDRYYLYRSRWRPDEPTVHLAPHWNWPDRVGEPVPVMVYTNGDSAELFLNGRSLGVRHKGDRPDAPSDWAEGAEFVASSEREGETAARLAEPASQQPSAGWAASGHDRDAWLSVDFGESRPVHTLLLEFPRESKLYGYAIELSDDGEQWRRVAQHTATLEPMWGGVPEAIHRIDDEARHCRVVFDEGLDGARPALLRFSATAGPMEIDYYAPTYDYRLRWNDVAYESGELRAVAFKDGEVLGESVVRTAGPPAELRVTADRVELDSSGVDLAYLTVEALDANGVACPLASDEVTIAIEGPAGVAGVGNGNPLSLAPFQGDRVSLFYGKAVAMIRPGEGSGGEIVVTVSAEGLQSASCRLSAKRP